MQRVTDFLTFEEKVLLSCNMKVLLFTAFVATLSYVSTVYLYLFDLVSCLLSFNILPLHLLQANAGKVRKIP